MAKKNRQSAAKARAAELRRQQEAAERRRRLVLAATTIGVIVAIVAVMVAVAMWPKDEDAATTAGTGGGPLSAAATRSLTTIPAATFDKVGLGSAGDFLAKTSNAPARVKDGQAVTADGKPQILYVGAQYCPYCAGLRWSAAAALARFGTFGPLQTTTSAPSPEVYPSTATISFSKPTFTSKYVTFTGYETRDNVFKNGQYGKLDEMTSADSETEQRLNKPPYVQSAGAIPFMSFGGKVVHGGAVFDTSVLQGRSADQIAAALADPDDDITKAVVGGANVITAAICEQTGNQPADVCSSAAVKQALTTFKTAG
ncbi:DUF929 family protein [Arsenicicoccus piscis]|uniref:DUF929 domain-containing protein n=1 Tax=Arsenicicoccus piscis TaxID=673954 RepID=A0ABQ6HJJ8_9MICO|nr:DUF929 family protein [Arsenicicoccus piscis]GMA18656.1 hypothetical protein GCM10025862_06770 [Arsenicicoccus piscis]